jgi:hypothetical protein
MAEREARAAEQTTVEPAAPEAAGGAGLGAVAFGAFTPALVVSLQRSAGNQAVSRMLAAGGQMVQRDDGAGPAGGAGPGVADPPPAPLPKGFEWFGTDNAP